jgi:hypothetical protein
MTDGAYRKQCSMLRRASRYFHLASDNTDDGFLRYCEYHATEDGPDAMFTTMQLDRLDRLSGGEIDRGVLAGHDAYAPSVRAVLGAIEAAKTARKIVDSP